MACIPFQAKTSSFKSTRFAASEYRNHTDTSPDAGESASGRFCAISCPSGIQADPYLCRRRDAYHSLCRLVNRLLTSWKNFGSVRDMKGLMSKSARCQYNDDYNILIGRNEARRQPGEHDESIFIGWKSFSLYRGAGFVIAHVVLVSC